MTYDPTQSEWYIDAKNNVDDFYIHSPYIDEVTGDYVVTIAKAVVVDGNFLGVIGLDIDMSNMSEKLNIIKYGENGAISVMDKDGVVIFDHNEEELGSNNSKKYSKWSEISSKDEGSVTTNYSGEKYIVYHITDEQTGWKILLKLPYSEFNSEETRLFVQLSGAFIFISILIYLTAYIGSVNQNRYK